MQNISAEYIKDKVIIVTGAGSGFGRLISQQATALGAKVLAADISRQGLDETAAICGNEATLLTQICDVTDSAQVQELAARAVKDFETIDVMINNAGTMPLAFYRDHAQAQEAWSRCIDINFKGVLHGISAVYDQMLAQGRGHVINLSSIYGNFPVAGAGVYGATKAAVNFLSESLRVESQGKIKVTTVKPTGVPGTNLASGVVNLEAISGILGQNAEAFFAQMQRVEQGEVSASELNPESPEYMALDPVYIANAVIYAIAQPWGVSLGDITVRATGDGYVL